MMFRHRLRTYPLRSLQKWLNQRYLIWKRISPPNLSKIIDLKRTSGIFFESILFVRFDLSEIAFMNSDFFHLKVLQIPISIGPHILYFLINKVLKFNVCKLKLVAVVFTLCAVEEAPLVEGYGVLLDAEVKISLNHMDHYFVRNLSNLSKQGQHPLVMKLVRLLPPDPNHIFPIIYKNFLLFLKLNDPYVKPGLNVHDLTSGFGDTGSEMVQSSQKV